MSYSASFTLANTETKSVKAQVGNDLSKEFTHYIQVIGTVTPALQFKTGTQPFPDDDLVDGTFEVELADLDDIELTGVGAATVFVRGVGQGRSLI